MARDLPQAIRELYLQFDPTMLDNLSDVYAENIYFCDPLHEVSGLWELRRYFAAAMEGLEECRFEFHHSLELPGRGEAVLFWTMHYRHRKLAGGKLLSLPGNSHVRFAEKVHYHRDYYDVGAMLYEKLPLVGAVIRHIKRGLGTK